VYAAEPSKHHFSKIPSAFVERVLRCGSRCFILITHLKTLHLYLTRQIVVSLLMTSVVFTLVLLIGNLLREVLLLLVSRQATFSVVAEAIALLVPFVWTFALPMGMLTATLLVFGRFSADQELTAARASGVSLLSLAAPILALSLVLCGLSAWMNLEICPRSWVAYRNLIRTFRVDIASAQLPEGRLIKDFPGYYFLIGKNHKGHLEDVMVFFLNDKTNVTLTLLAQRGEFQYDATNNMLHIQIFNSKGLNISEGGSSPAGTGSEMHFDFDLTQKRSDDKKPGISFMTYSQLQDELRDLEQAMSLPMDVKSLAPEQLKQLKRELEKQKFNRTLQIRVQMHREVAVSFACFGFTLIGIPLGVRVHRRETNVGAAMALLLAFIYYSFVLAGQAFDRRPELAPYLIVWLPNFIFQAVGAVLLWRANRGV
jgi:lipopolysaccharide export system permease protein